MPGGNGYQKAMNNDFSEVMSSTAQQNNQVLGRVNIGWTIGEELLFDANPH